jgi:glycolate oxidase
VTFEQALAKILPPESLLTSEEAKRPFECDGLSAYQQIPRVVVLPSTKDEVRGVVKVCAEFGVPIIPRGAGTGLSGGALPLAEGCLLSLAKFNRIIKIDLENRIAVVEPGVRNLAISQAVARHGLYYAPDPSSQIACSIGGNVAENSGGVHSLKYGLTVNNVLQLDMLTADGDWVTLGCDALDSPGYDSLALLHGSEGLLGIIMQVTVKLLPIPPVARVLLGAFDEVESAAAAVAGVIAAGIIPAGLEMMDHLAINVAEDFCHAGYPRDAAAILLCELDGTVGEVDSQIDAVEAIFSRNKCTSVQVSNSEAERLRFWAGRKSAFPAMGRIAPDYYCIDGTIPRRHIGVVLTRIAELSAQYGLPVANVFHAGDGNLHPLIAYDANDDAQLEAAEQIGGKILELCVAVGGTITGEHGVGVEKLDQMCVQFSSGELRIFHQLKEAFDGAGLLNPGKAIPTLSRCAEFGAMHVHGGQLPHPEIERF